MARRSRKSVTGRQRQFAHIPAPRIPRSILNRSAATRTTFDAGVLVPIMIDEALPGDTLSLRTTALCRLQTLWSPIMDNLYVDLFFFSVPNRLIYDEWEKLCGAQDNPADSTDYLVPTMTSPAVTGYAALGLHDYLGIPPGVPDLEHSSLWHRAYNLIWNEWFRSENLQNSVVVDKDEGPDDPADYVLLSRGKRADYFTSCLPWPQKGDAVTLPIGTTAPVIASGDGIPEFEFESTGGYKLQSTGATAGTSWDSAHGTTQTAEWDDPKLQADLSSATGATINAIRQAFQLQRLLERDARGGTRYVESIWSHFGVTSPDFRLQRPEFLGGGTQPMFVKPVEAHTSVGTTWMGDLGALGVAGIDGIGFNKSFTEHCVIIGLACVRADLTYQQGLPRMLSRSTRWDFFWPSLAHIGEQAVLNKEIYAQGSDGGTDDDDVFGYQERYAEYRYKPSQVTGAFRSSYATTLDWWHLAQDFASLPTLSSGFIAEDPPVDRVVTVPAQHHVAADFWFDMKHARPMPMYGVPGLIDHF